MGLLLRSSPLKGSTEGEGVGVTVREGRSESVSTWLYTICMLHNTATVELPCKDTVSIGHLSKNIACCPCWIELSNSLLLN